MLNAVFFGVLVGITLVAGGLAGARKWMPARVTGALLALASGTLMAAVAFDLIGEPLENEAAWIVGAALATGAVSFLAVDKYLDEHRTSGAGLLAGVVMDGVPENLALGTSLGPALLFGILASNFPEAVGGAEQMREDGRSIKQVVALWSAAAAILVAAVIVGYFASQLIGSKPTAALRSFAGGAVLATLFTEAVPQAYREGGIWGALAGIGGFFVAALLA